MQLEFKEEPSKLEKAADSKFALPVELMAGGGLIIALIFANRIVDIAIMAIGMAGAYYIGTLRGKK